MSATAQASRAGRPRDALLHQQLIVATQEILLEVGYDRLTIEAVAARVGAGKTTVYRRWPNKAALVLDAVSALHRSQPPPATGALRPDLLALGHTFIGSDARRTAVIAGLSTAMAHDDHLRAAVLAALGAPRTLEFVAVIEAAAQRGEVRHGCDVPLVGRLFPALAFHQLAALGIPVDAALVERVVDHVLLPLLVEHPSR